MLGTSLIGCGAAAGQQNASIAETSVEAAVKEIGTRTAEKESQSGAKANANTSVEKASQSSAESDENASTEKASKSSAQLAVESTGKKAEELSPEAEVERLIEEYISTMPLEDKVSGLFIVTPEALTGYSAVTEAGDITREALKNLPVAGLAYFAANIENRDQLSRMLKKTKKWGSVKIPARQPVKDAGGKSESEEKASEEAASRETEGKTEESLKASEKSKDKKTESVKASGKTEGKTSESAKESEKSGDEKGNENEEKNVITIPLFLSVDEEGGAVARIANSGIEVPYVGSMRNIGDSEDIEKAFEAGDTIGEYLHELGFNLDFAPDADVLIDPSNETIGDRSFGSDPELCGRMAAKYIEGLHENKIASCAKHFPGLGDTETDSHTGEAWSSRTLEDYRKAEFISFQSAIKAGTDMIMVAHLSNTELTGSDLPASLNKVVITDILRDELGYEGVIITDSFQMGAVTERFDSADAAVTAFEAGADLLLMPVDFGAARKGILDAVESGRISEERIDESLRRIFLTRYNLEKK